MTGIVRRGTPNQAPVPAWRAQRRAPVLERRFGAHDLIGLRSDVGTLAAELVDADAADEMALVAHELAANAVKHGGGRGRLRLWTTGGGLRCEISDNGPGLRNPHLAGVTRPAPNTPGGRGLWIVRQMSDLTIATTEAGTTVTASVPRD